MSNVILDQTPHPTLILCYLLVCVIVSDTTLTKRYNGAKMLSKEKANLVHSFTWQLVLWMVLCVLLTALQSNPADS